MARRRSQLSRTGIAAQAIVIAINGIMIIQVISTQAVADETACLHRRI